jgi:hypothetical protein
MQAMEKPIITLKSEEILDKTTNSSDFQTVREWVVYTNIMVETLNFWKD